MRRALLIIAVTIAVVALGVWLGPRTLRARQLASARERWEAAGVAHYRWTIETGCFGACTNGEPATIEVIDGRAIRVSTPWTFRRLAMSTPLAVEALFDRVDRDVGSDGFSVTYDDTYGYPVSGSIDRARNSTDDEFGFTVTGFQPIA